MRDGSQISGKLVHQAQAFLDRLEQIGIPFGKFLFEGNQVQVQRDQYLARGIVQFTSDAASFIILHPQEPSGEGTQTFLRMLKLSSAVPHSSLQLLTGL